MFFRYIKIVSFRQRFAYIILCVCTCVPWHVCWGQRTSMLRPWVAASCAGFVHPVTAAVGSFSHVTDYWFTSDVCFLLFLQYSSAFSNHFWALRGRHIIQTIWNWALHSLLVSAFWLVVGPALISTLHKCPFDEDWEMY